MKYTLEVELTDDEFCMDCPCYDGDWMSCKKIREFLDSDENNKPLRSANCPLKPVEEKEK